MSDLHLIRQAFGPEDLFSGLMSRLGPSPDEPGTDDGHVPTCRDLGRELLPWESALATLDCVMIRHEGQYTSCCLVELSELRKLFEGVYGDASGACNMSAGYRHVLGWLYRLNGQYIRAVQDGQVAALVILAYFSVLLKTLQDEGWLGGWAEHVRLVVGRIVKDPVWSGR